MSASSLLGCRCRWMASATWCFWADEHNVTLVTCSCSWRYEAKRAAVKAAIRSNSGRVCVFFVGAIHYFVMVSDDWFSCTSKWRLHRLFGLLQQKHVVLYHCFQQRHQKWRSDAETQVWLHLLSPLLQHAIFDQESGRGSSQSILSFHSSCIRILAAMVTGWSKLRGLKTFAVSLVDHGGIEFACLSENCSMSEGVSQRMPSTFLVGLVSRTWSLAARCWTPGLFELCNMRLKPTGDILFLASW